MSGNGSLNNDMDIVVNSKHVKILQKATNCLLAAKSQLLQELHIDTTASEIRQSLEILGEITGTFENERMLDLVFSNFCVGK
jgi:tRNA modification GTPase